LGGERGEKGERGLPGPPGPGIKTASIDRYVVEVKQADGSVVQIDFLPMLELYNSEKGE